MMLNIYGAKAPWPFLKGLVRDNRPIWFLEETGLSYSRISLDPTQGENKSPQYTALNRFQKVPTLDDNGLIIKQSAAILHHLASSTGKLYPHSTSDQIKHLEWMFFCVTDIESHAVQLRTIPEMVEEKDRAHADWMLARAEKILARALDYLEAELEGHTYLMGEVFYAVDIMLGCSLYPIHEHKLIMDRPRIRRVLEKYFSRPAFQRMLEINGT